MYQSSTTIRRREPIAQTGNVLPVLRLVSQGILEASKSLWARLRVLHQRELYPMLLFLAEAHVAAQGYPIVSSLGQEHDLGRDERCR